MRWYRRLWPFPSSQDVTRHWRPESADEYSSMRKKSSRAVPVGNLYAFKFNGPVLTLWHDRPHNIYACQFHSILLHIPQNSLRPFFMPYRDGSSLHVVTARLRALAWCHRHARQIIISQQTWVEGLGSATWKHKRKEFLSEAPLAGSRYKWVFNVAFHSYWANINCR